MEKKESSNKYLCLVNDKEKITPSIFRGFIPGQSVKWKLYN